MRIPLGASVVAPALLLLVSLSLTLWQERQSAAAAESGPGGKPAAQKLVVIVAKGSKVKSLSRAELRRAFLGEPVSAAGTSLVPFNSQPGTPARSGFDQAVLGMSPSEVGRFWVDRKVRGQAPAPRSLPSMAHVLKVVAKFPGAISYAPADQLTAAVQAVSIDGVAPTDAKYPIKVP